MTLQSPQLSPRLQLCEDMTWEAGKGYRTCLSITKKVQCAACTPGLTASFTPQACMSGGQQAIPFSTLTFTSLFAPLPLLKQSRNLVGNYQNVMGKKIWVKPCSAQVSGSKGNYARSRFFKVNIHSTDSKNWLLVLGLAVSGSSTWCAREESEEETLQQR